MIYEMAIFLEGRTRIEATARACEIVEACVRAGLPSISFTLREAMELPRPKAPPAPAQGTADTGPDEPFP